MVGELENPFTDCGNITRGERFIGTKELEVLGYITIKKREESIIIIPTSNIISGFLKMSLDLRVIFIRPRAK